MVTTRELKIVSSINPILLYPKFKCGVSSILYSYWMTHHLIDPHNYNSTTPRLFTKNWHRPISSSDGQLVILWTNRPTTERRAFNQQVASASFNNAWRCWNIAAFRTLLLSMPQWFMTQWSTDVTAHRQASLTRWVSCVTSCSSWFGLRQRRLLSDTAVFINISHRLRRLSYARTETVVKTSSTSEDCFQSVLSTGRLLQS